MAMLIKHRSLVVDSWRLLEEPADRLLITGEDGLLPDLPTGSLIVPLRVWRLRRDDLLGSGRGAGVWIATDAEPAALTEDVARLAVIAIRFASFTDGRGYSAARLLRERYGYRGELRAIGDVTRDLLSYLAACGFDAFALREGEDPQAALAAFDDFSDTYHATIEQPDPLFRRRLTGAYA
jgi:uncharacterized protein (DUF934 family)